MFVVPGRASLIVKLWHDKYEKKRQELITIVKAARDRLIADLSRHAGLSPSVAFGSCISRRQSVPDLKITAGGGSQMSEGQSKQLLEGVVSESHRENYEKIVQKAKEREIGLMNKMLRNEEMKNSRYEELQRQKETLEARENGKERRRARSLRQAQEERMQHEFERVEGLKKEEQMQRLEAQERMRMAMERQAKEQEKELEKERERQREMAEREKGRKEKSEKAATMREQELFKQEVKLNLMKEKLCEKEKLIRVQREELKRKAKLRRQQFDAIKQRVQTNLELEQSKKLQEFLERKRRKDSQEREVWMRKKAQVEELKQKAEETNMKIQQAIAESQKIVEARKTHILFKQRQAELRLEEQHAKQVQDELQRHELVLIKNEIKKMNAARKTRKDHYKIDKVREQLAFDEMRRNSFEAQKNEFKNLRLRNQTQAQMQRQLIRTALYNMAVWNVWDMDVVKKIVSDPQSVRGKTIQEIIRRRAGQAELGRRHASVMARAQSSLLAEGKSQPETARSGNDEDTRGTTHYITAKKGGQKSDFSLTPETSPHVSSKQLAAASIGSGLAAASPPKHLSAAMIVDQIKGKDTASPSPVRKSNAEDPAAYKDDFNQ